MIRSRVRTSARAIARISLPSISSSSLLMIGGPRFQAVASGLKWRMGLSICLTGWLINGLTIQPKAPTAKTPTAKTRVRSK